MIETFVVRSCSYKLYCTIELWCRLRYNITQVWGQSCKMLFILILTLHRASAVCMLCQKEAYVLPQEAKQVHVNFIEIGIWLP